MRVDNLNPNLLSEPQQVKVKAARAVSFCTKSVLCNL